MSVLNFLSPLVFLVTACSHSPPSVYSSQPAELILVAPKLMLPRALESSTVILLGETHYYTPFEAYEFILNLAASRPRLCLAVEFPSGSTSFEPSLKELRRRAVAVKKSGKLEDNKRINRVLHTYEKLLKVSQSYNIRIFGVDHPKHYLTQMDVEQRNKAMAKNISDLIKSGECLHVLAILGKAHLTLGSFRNSTVKMLLGNEGVDSASVNLQMTNETDVPKDYQSFSLSGLVAPQSEFEWIENKSLPKMIRVLPYIKNDFSVWQEFDLTLLVPANFSPQSF